MIETLVIAVLLVSSLVIGVVAAVRCLLDALPWTRHRRAGAERAAAGRSPVAGYVRMADEEDARLWGFGPDWMAAERLELQRAWWKEQT